MRVGSRLLLLVVLGSSFGCRKTEAPVIVGVLRDPSSSFAERLRRADLQFSISKPHLGNGKGVMTATNEGKSFSVLLSQINQVEPQLLILNAESDLTDDSIRGKLGPPKPVCGGHPAFVAHWVSGEEREAAEMYVEFLETHCEGVAVR